MRGKGETSRKKTKTEEGKRSLFEVKKREKKKPQNQSLGRDQGGQRKK